MGITWAQVRESQRVTDERRRTGETFYCDGCEKEQQESFFDTLGIEHCSACYAPIFIRMEWPPGGSK